MNKIVVLSTEGRLANQLWHYASIYSFCLEKGYDCENYAFFRYQHYFKLQSANIIIKLLNYLSLHYPKRWKILSVMYLLYIKILKVFFSSQMIDDAGKVFFLPPTVNYNAGQISKLEAIQTSERENGYFCGWLFRNPAGQEKYYSQIKEYFKPVDPWNSWARNYIKDLRERYKLVVGVHIRQGDYRTWDGGQFYFNEAEVRDVLNEFIAENSNIALHDAVFVICSDEGVDQKYFAGLNCVLGPGSEIVDLYTLSLTDMIIGSTSTYGSWAAYYGDIPYARFSHEKIDWSDLNGKIKNIYNKQAS